MINIEEVEYFLRDFKHKLGFWCLLFRSDRVKNFNTMLVLEISISHIRAILNELDVMDYSEGSIAETLYYGAYK